MISLPDITILSQIYESANSFVYRGILKSNQQPLILKLLKEDYPTPAELYPISRNTKSLAVST